jgi:hypothetical protein
MCEEMRFSSSDGVTSSTVALDSRSLLRVPSLNSSTSATYRSKAVSDHVDRSSLCSFSIVDYTGSPLHHHTILPHWVGVNKVTQGQQNGLPAYVNYRPEEMNRTPDGWQLSSNCHLQGNWAVAAEKSSPVVGANEKTISPYSPNRIRSSRGAYRRSIGSASAENTQTTNTNKLNETGSSSKRAFPVSNRGMGRRNIVASTSIAKGRSSIITNDEVVMLVKIQASSPHTSEQTSVQSSETNLPCSGLKRKLPIIVAAMEDSKPSVENTGITFPIK